MLEKKTNLGDIRFSKGVIERVIDDAVSACEGKVTLQNFKGKYKSVIPGSEEVHISEEPDGVHIIIYVVIRFGASIKDNTAKIMDYIDRELDNLMGEKSASVKIVVTGVQSKTIARRHIEITHGITG